jgi:hypothetical protein
MPVPSYRVPVRVARGTKAALTAGLTDLQEGELCYATDENILYVIEGGVLTATVADLTGIEIVNDTTPQLGGNLDTNSFQIISTAAGNIQIAPDTTGVLEVMGNTGNDAAIQLNCETNAHGIKLKSPPHSAAATYTLVFPNDTGTSGQALTTDGAGVMSWSTPSTVGSINDLTDVDTTTTAPTNDQVLAWNGTNWVPANQSGGGGGGGSSAARLTEAQTAASGIATFVGIGHSGTLVEVTSSLDAWIVLYDSAASRTADSGRAYSTDPTPGSGVLAEFYITTGTTVLATPGTTYFNNDTSVTEAVYAAVRDQAGANVNSQVTIVAYGNQTITSVSGGTFGSGV